MDEGANEIGMSASDCGVRVILGRFFASFRTLLHRLGAYGGEGGCYIVNCYVKLLCANTLNDHPRQLSGEFSIPLAFNRF